MEPSRRPSQFETDWSRTPPRAPGSYEMRPVDDPSHVGRVEVEELGGRLVYRLPEGRSTSGTHAVEAPADVEWRGPLTYPARPRPDDRAV